MHFAECWISFFITNLFSVFLQLQECIGAAVVAMGPERLLSLMPISLDKGNLTCSNTWLIAILKKFVIGASLQFFIEHVVPLARSLRKAYDKGMVIDWKQDLHIHFRM